MICKMTYTPIISIIIVPLFNIKRVIGMLIGKIQKPKFNHPINFRNQKVRFKNKIIQ